MNPGTVIAVGAAVGYFIASLLAGKLLPVLSFPAIAGAFLGAAAATALMFGAARTETDRPSRQRSAPVDVAALQKNRGQIIGDLCNPDPDLRAEALTNLAILDYIQAVPVLIQALRDDHPAVRLRATEALAWVTGKDFGESEEKWQEWWAQNKPAG
jgi:hypothetical protein